MQYSPFVRQNYFVSAGEVCQYVVFQNEPNRRAATPPPTQFPVYRRLQAFDSFLIVKRLIHW
jgi:hypothetical protein